MPSRRSLRAVKALRPQEAAALLERLMRSSPRVADEAERLARVMLADANDRTVARLVAHDLGRLGMEALYGRAGRQPLGYVEPSEAAWQVLDETIAPFVDDITRRRRLGLRGAAEAYARGVVLGLYSFERGDGELLQYAPDFPLEAAARALAACGRRSQAALPDDFVARHLPEWRRWLALG